jgi:hypothetical protein
MLALESLSLPCRLLHTPASALHPIMRCGQALAHGQHSLLSSLQLRAVASSNRGPAAAAARRCGAGGDGGCIQGCQQVLHLKAAVLQGCLQSGLLLALPG